ncbi:hypothetical protein FV241_17090 [Methylobacterium sp. WL2]|nr:hypothetical protein FVA80_25320 [Methylobacterium sp. WL1]TXN56112.1 hypothetical protein FV241_17090 [Methylobacterium sp. WL2]
MRVAHGLRAKTYRGSRSFLPAAHGIEPGAPGRQGRRRDARAEAPVEKPAATGPEAEASSRKVAAGFRKTRGRNDADHGAHASLRCRYPA